MKKIILILFVFVMLITGCSVKVDLPPKSTEMPEIGENVNILNFHNYLRFIFMTNYSKTQPHVFSDKK